MKLKTDQFKKIALMISVLMLFVTVTGCSLISSYFKKKDVDMASKYKNQLDRSYSRASKTPGKIDAFIKRLNKHYYTTEDFTDKDSFASVSKSLVSDITTAQNNLKEAKTSAAEFSKTSTGQKFQGYLKAKNSAIINLEKVLSADKKILDIITPAFNDFQNLFTYVDTLKKTQSSNITAAAIGVSRQNEKNSNQTLYEGLMNAKAMELAKTEQEATGSSGGSGGTDETETMNQFASPYTVEDLPSWVYPVIQNENISKYYIDMLNNQESHLSSLYTDIYQVDKKMKFKSSDNMLQALESIKTNLSELIDSTEVLSNNLIDQRRKNKLLDEYKNKKNVLGLTIENLKYQVKNPPNSVTSKSKEVQGYRDQLEDAENRHDKYEAKIKSLEDELKKLKTAQEGKLSDNAADDWWRYGGSLLGIIYLNNKVDKEMMIDIKAWQTTKIGRLIKNHNYLTKLAKYQSTKAIMEYERVNDKFALR